MKRLDFIKLNLLATAGLNILSINQNRKKASNQLLTGRQKPVLTQNDILDILVYPDFQKMQKAALKDGIKIQIISGYRSFNRQLSIWNKKYHKYKNLEMSEKDIFKKISTYSALPGTSRHHWGTEIDIIDANSAPPENGFLNPRNYDKDGVYNALYQWMLANSEDYGFYLVYTNDEHRQGFNFEPWHYSYKPLAKNYLKHYSRLELNIDVKDDRVGGSDHIDKEVLLSYFHTHVLGINPLLLP